MTNRKLLQQAPKENLQEYAETLIKLRRELGKPIDKKRVFLVGGSFHGQSVSANEVECKWPPYRYISHVPKLPVCTLDVDDTFYIAPADVYEFVRYSCGDSLYVYRQTISFDLE